MESKLNPYLIVSRIKNCRYDHLFWVAQKRRRHARAFSLWRTIERRCWSMMAQVDSVSSSPVAKAEFLASSDQTHLAILPQAPPTASTTIGMNVMPWARHSARVSWWLDLRSSYLLVIPSGLAASACKQAEATGDGEIPGGWRAQPPPGDVHVSRTPGTRPGVVLVESTAVLVRGTQQRPLGEQTRFFQFGPMISRLGSVIDHVPQQIVSTCAVATATAHQGVVTIPIQDTVA